MRIRMLMIASALLCVSACSGADQSLLTDFSSPKTAGDGRDSLNLVRSREAALKATSQAQEAQPPSAPLRSLIAGTQWVNTAPLKPEDLRGKVVVVNFWTYSCINSLRTLPYLRAWAEKYQNRGLVVIGVHTPEFAFEHDPTKVGIATAELPVGYPVVMDNDYAIWSAYNNNAWPAFYFIDAKGRIRHRALGEGAYDQAERWIQKLLSEVSGVAVAGPVADPSGRGAEAPPAWKNLRSPETYLGYARAENFSSPGNFKPDTSKGYETAANLQLNHWSLSGAWTISKEHASLDAAPGRIAFRFHARDLHLVLGRAAQNPIRFRITIDGRAPGADHGVDVDGEGWGALRQDRMYQLVRQSGAISDRTFEIEFLEPGARAYAFTFG